MDNREALEKDTPINRMIKMIYGYFEDGYSLFEVFCLLSDEYWQEFKRFIEEPKNFYHVAFACWHWSCDQEWIDKEELINIMSEFEEMVKTAELGRTGKLVEKKAHPGWNMESGFIVV